MLKKLLVAAVALSFVASLCVPAMAAKSPNEAKKLKHSLPEGQFRGVIIPIDDRPNYETPQSYNETATPPGTSLTRSPYACSDLYWDCNLTYYIGPPHYGAAQRFSTGSEACSLKTISFPVYLAGSSTPNSGGITVYVWADNAGAPGAVIYSVPVPHGSVVYFPTVQAVNVAPGNIVLGPGTDYHIGWIPNNTGDTYAGLTDDGTCGVGRGNIWDGIGWTDNATAFGLDLNWSITSSVCCFTPGAGGICADQIYHGPLFYRWGGKDPKAVRFTADDYCTLKTVMINFSAGGQVGTGGIDITVYDDAATLPGPVVGFQHVAHGALTIPGQTTLNVSGLGLVFNQEDFHVGYSITNTVTDDYQLRSDDGLQGTGRSTIYDLAGGGPWLNNNVAFAPDDYNWLIDANLCCAAPTPSQCFNLDYTCGAFYYWTIPDAYGDDFFNMRFTNPTLCTLKTICMSFFQAGSVGTPGANYYIWNSDGTFPTSVVTTVPINPVTNWFPVEECVDVSALNLTFSSDYHVGYTPIFNSLSDILAIISDDGSCGTLRSSEYYLGGWGLMANDWGVDVNFFINVDICCVPPGYCPIICSPTDDWPTWAHDYARTSQSELTLGDLCGIRLKWSHLGVAPNANINPGASPIIADDKVFVAYDNRLKALNLLTGAVIWDTRLHAHYPAIINNGLRVSATYEAGVVYFATGSLRGFAAANAATGDTIWVRHSANGNPLPGVVGTTRFSNSVINGSEIYFGDDNGQMYALNKATGANLYFGQLLNHDGVKRSTNTSPAWDGTRLYWGTGVTSAGTSNDGDVYGVTPGGSFTQNWIFTSPFQATIDEGFSSSPSFRCDNLFIICATPALQGAGYQGYRQNLDPATGIPIWPDYFLMGRGLFAPPATTNDMVYFANEVGFIPSAVGAARGVRAVNFLNSTVWNNVGTGGAADNNVAAHATVTCDPYVIYGTRDFATNQGFWNIADGATGSILVQYAFTGHMLATAIGTGSDGSDYLVVLERFRNFGATSLGAVYAFNDQGPRPRMQVPQTLVAFAPTNTAESAPVQRTDPDAVKNIGCLSLNVLSATLEAGAPPSQRRITSVNPELEKQGEILASNLVDYRVEDMLSTVAKTKSFGLGTYNEETDMADMPASMKPAKANSEVLAPPTWVDWVVPFSGGPTVSFAVVPGGDQDFTFEFDRNNMLLLGQNYFFVDITSDDPDYNPENPAATPQASIEYTIDFVYCPDVEGFMQFGATGQEWYSNRFEIGDGSVNFDFSIVNGADDNMYEATAYFMTSMNSAAWNTYPEFTDEFSYLYPFYYSGTTCGDCDFGVPLPVDYTIDGGNTYNPTTGDVCGFAVIDSLQDAGVSPHQAGPSMGILVKFKEVGTYGADFGDFKLVIVEVTNRNAAPLNGLYSGALVDWDVAPYDNNLGGGNAAKGYIYTYEIASTQVYGQIGIPQAGSYWPDGSKTDPMYNGRLLHNVDDIYNSNSLDSLYNWVNDVPEDVLAASPNEGTPDDKTYVVAFDKSDLAGNASVKYGYAIFGLASSASINADVEAVAAFANKYAGFARGDVDNNNMIDLRDLVRLSRYVAALGPGPEPFKHLGDVDNDGDVDGADCSYLAAYYFTGGPPPKSDFKFAF